MASPATEAAPAADPYAFKPEPEMTDADMQAAYEKMEAEMAMDAAPAPPLGAHSARSPPATQLS